MPRLAQIVLSSKRFLQVSAVLVLGLIAVGFGPSTTLERNWTDLHGAATRMVA